MNEIYKKKIPSMSICRTAVEREKIINGAATDPGKGFGSLL